MYVCIILQVQVNGGLQEYSTRCSRLGRAHAARRIAWCPRGMASTDSSAGTWQCMPMRTDDTKTPGLTFGGSQGGGMAGEGYGGYGLAKGQSHLGTRHAWTSTTRYHSDCRIRTYGLLVCTQSPPHSYSVCVRTRRCQAQASSRAAAARCNADIMGLAQVVDLPRCPVFSPHARSSFSHACSVCSALLISAAGPVDSASSV